MKRSKGKIWGLVGTFVALIAVGTPGCGTRAGNGLGGNVTVQSNPLAGPNSASTLKGFPNLAFEIFRAILWERSAWATVSSFTLFQACNDTMVFIDSNGNNLSLNGSATPQVGAGLLTFSPTSQVPVTIGSITIPAGTVIKEVDITFATVPDLCGGANYAVRFDPGTGPLNITQNTAFKFPFTAGDFSVTGSPQTVTLLFGQIVNGMVSLGAGLNNSSIQTVNVGQAK